MQEAGRDVPSITTNCEAASTFSQVIDLLSKKGHVFREPNAPRRALRDALNSSLLAESDRISASGGGA